jgi:hypothetical protein
MHRSAKLLAIVGVVMLVCASVASARLRAPGLQGPRNGVTVQSLPAFTWSGVKGAATYQFQFSADRSFSSGVTGFGTGISVHTTAVTNDRTIPNGTYYWRIRADSAADHPGRWSAVRVLRKFWTSAPQLLSPLSATVNWPSQSLVFQWSPVPYAVQYNVFIATDPALSHLVLGSVTSPVQVQGPQFALPSVLPPATYYWAIQPVDAEGYQGVRSATGSFTWAWPSATSVTESNISSDSTVSEPSFSWVPIPGAASYEIEISRATDFPIGSDVIDQQKLLGTTYTPNQILPNETTLYWRIRARDIGGDAGAWNVGQPFTESFDQSPPSVQNLSVADTSANHTDPIVTWSPVPGASSYYIVVAPWTGTVCDFNNAKHTVTPTTAWTPIGEKENIGWEQEYGFPGPNGGIILNAGSSPGVTGSYCISVSPQRDDSPIAGGSLIRSAPTLLGGGTTASFAYTTPPPQSGTLQATPSNNYLEPGPVNTTPTLTTTPLFQWNAVPGAAGYYVVLARDAGFTNVVNVGYTQTTAYAPPISLLDETSAYYWEIVPQDASGTVINPQDGENHPQAFNKSSTPPTPLSPINGAAVQTQPTFSWSSASGARNYTLQVATDPSFANPLVNVTTDSTSYTSTDTLPAEKTLYWQVRANDSRGDGLNWSWTFYQDSVFTHHLPAPAPSAGNPTGGSTIPVLSWTPVAGATGYNMFVTQANGSTESFSFVAPAMSPTEFYGTGNWHWQVQAVFPGGESSAYFVPQSYVRTIPAPTGVHATKSGTRIVISWAPSNVAKQYRAQLATTDGFSSPVASDNTDNTVWVPQINSVTAARKLYWRLGTLDRGGNVGAYAQGVFRAPPHKHKRAACKRTKKHPRCTSTKKKHK